MRKRNAFICLIALAAVLGFGSVKNSSSNLAVQAAATGDTTSSINLTGSKSSGTDAQGVVWNVTGNGYKTNSNYLQLYGASYISNSTAIKVDTNSPATMKLNVRKYGGPSNDQATVKVCAYDAGGNAISNEVSIVPTSKNLDNYGSDNNIVFTKKSAHSEVFFRFTSSSSATDGQNVGISAINVTYTAGKNIYLDTLTLKDYPTSNISISDTGTVSYSGLNNFSEAWSGTVKYYSTNPFLLEIDENTGEYTAIAAGEVDVYCKAIGAGNNNIDVTSAGITFHIDEKLYDYPLESNPTFGAYSTSMFINGVNATQDLVINYMPYNCDEDFNVYSSNSKVIDVSLKTPRSNGTVVYTLTALSNGKANIIVDGLMGDNSSSTEQITVSTNILESVTVTGDISKTTYQLGESWSNEGLTATANYTDGSHVDVTSTATWSYTPATPIAAGVGANKSLTATATYNDKSVSVTVNDLTVNYADVTNISISSDKTTLFVDNVANVSATINENASISGINWTVSDDEIISITSVDDGNIKVTALKAGTATLSASINEVTSNVITFNVVGKINEISYSKTINETATWTASKGALGSSNNPVLSFNDDKGNAWSITHTNTAYIEFASSQYNIGSKANPDSITLTCSSIPGIIKSVAFNASTNGNHTYKVSVGGVSYGNGTLKSSMSEYKFTGSSEGLIKIEITKGSTNAQFALKSFSIVYEGFEKSTIGNNLENSAAQKAVIDFSKKFMDTLEPYCVSCDTSDVGFKTAWLSLANEYNNVFGSNSSLSTEDISAAKIMFANATPVSKGVDGSDIVQNAMARYDLLLSRDDSLDAFMARNISSSSRFITPNRNLDEKIALDDDSNMTILVVTLMSSITLASLYLLKKKRVSK